MMAWSKLFTDGKELRHQEFSDGVRLERELRELAAVACPDLTVAVCMTEDAGEIGELLAKKYSWTYVK